jgi:hypothetical protein
MKAARFETILFKIGPANHALQQFSPAAPDWRSNCFCKKPVNLNIGLSSTRTKL